MRKGNKNMVHERFPDVNGQIYLWRDDKGVLHASKENQGMTMCGRYADYMTYAGRLGAPTCLQCVTAP